MKTNSKNNKARAFFRGGILTLDLPRAREPLLWRQEVRNVKNISFSIHNGSQGGHELVLRVGENADQIIAIFDQQDAADDALAALRQIVLRQSRPSIMIRLGKWILILFLIFSGVLWAFQTALNAWLSHQVSQALAQPDAPPPAETQPTTPPPDATNGP